MNVSNPNAGPSSLSPPVRRRRPPQISLGFMLLTTVVLAVMSAGLFYASRVQAVQEEISVLSGGSVGQSGDDVGRLAHIIFIMFTLTSPLLLAGALSTAVVVFRWLQRRPQ